MPLSGDRSIAIAANALSRFGFFGLIWLDRELVVTETFGSLAGFAALGRPVTESIVAFIGLEADIMALEYASDRLLELPAVSVAEADGDNIPRKLNFTISWDAATSRVLVLVYRTSATSELELELSKQIRARLMAEEEVEAKSRELARANSDLEAFAGIVSHDLKAPLRHMSYMADLATQDVGRGDAATTAQRLGEIRELNQRMSAMLTALFDYSSLGRKDEASELVDTAELIQSICRSLPLSGFDVAVSGDWPKFKTLRAPLDLVLRNLIANAARHHDLSTGTIQVSGIERGKLLEIVIADDGPGIGDKDQAVVFLPFRTLGGAGVEWSTGMGLAIVKRALESVGGTIALSSNPDCQRGSVFTVMWPMQLSV